MTAFSRSRLLMLGFSVIAPVLVAVACASEPQDPPSDCSNTQTDPFNCGECGHACTQGQFCQSGSCACTPPYAACGPNCLNLQGDPNNCGSCGNVCPPTANFCSNGACSATCGQTQCGNLCTNTASDILNCGACNTQCPTGSSCVNGSCACPAGTTPCNGACMTTCGNGGTGGTPGSGGTVSTGGTVTGGTGGQGGTAPTGGAAGSGTSGSGGMGPVMKVCATKVTVAAPTITDFESYDGTMPAHGTGSWIFTMGPATAPSYAGLYPLSEGTTPPASYMLTMAAGAAASNWAARAVNPTTMDWGGGLGFWMGCINASAYSGITFQVRGTSPTGMANFSLAMEDATPPDAANPAGGGTCDPAPAEGCAGPSFTFPITIDWTPVTIPWAMFSPGRGAGGVAIVPTGDEISGMSFGANVNYVPNPVDGGMPAYVPEPGAFELAVDNLAFTP
jgi:hypothetical protein